MTCFLQVSLWNLKIILHPLEYIIIWDKLQKSFVLIIIQIIFKHSRSSSDSHVSEAIIKMNPTDMQAISSISPPVLSKQLINLLFISNPYQRIVCMSGKLSFAPLRITFYTKKRIKTNVCLINAQGKPALIYQLTNWFVARCCFYGYFVRIARHVFNVVTFPSP